MKAKSRWIEICLVMPSPEDMKRGMELATKFEDRHGGHPPMFFSVHTGINTVAIVVFTKKSNYLLKRMVRDFGAVETSLHLINGNWGRVHLYRAAVHLSDQPSNGVRDEVQQLMRMLNYDYVQEARFYTSCADLAFGISNLRLPNG